MILGDNIIESNIIAATATFEKQSLGALFREDLIACRECLYFASRAETNGIFRTFQGKPASHFVLVQTVLAFATFASYNMYLWQKTR